MSPWQVLRHPGCGLSRRQPTASAVAMGSSRRWYIRPVEMSFDYISVKLFSRLTKNYLWLQCDWTQMWPETNFIVAHNGYKVIEDICTAKWIHSRCMYICLSTCLHKYIYIYIYAWCYMLSQMWILGTDHISLWSQIYTIVDSHIRQNAVTHSVDGYLGNSR